ncbi:hypothetical protein HON71_03495 [Candidatus Woesearchaeota archaeon]|jgi:glutaredoxin|nr:hypothetical protein [Candidatus Woesearchaeota archaeon]
MIKKIISILMLATFLLVVGCSSNNTGPGQYDTFAQCLTEKGVKMYGTEWCSHCKNQKAAFGNSFQFVDYVDCDKNKNECSLAGVEGYPTWKINGKNYPGEQQLNKLASLSGCELN